MMKTVPTMQAMLFEILLQSGCSSLFLWIAIGTPILGVWCEVLSN